MGSSQDSHLQPSQQVGLGSTSLDVHLDGACVCPAPTPATGQGPPVKAACPPLPGLGGRQPWTTLSLQPYPLHQRPRWEHMFTIFSRLGVSKGRHRGGGGLGKPVEFLMGFPYNYNGGTWLRAGQGLAKTSLHPPSFLGWE